MSEASIASTSKMLRLVAHCKKFKGDPAIQTLDTPEGRTFCGVGDRFARDLRELCGEKAYRLFLVCTKLSLLSIGRVAERFTALVFDYCWKPKVVSSILAVIVFLFSLFSLYCRRWSSTSMKPKSLEHLFSLHPCVDSCLHLAVSPV